MTPGMRRPPAERDIERHLPLKPLVFQVLLCLADGERHGWSLVREVQQRGGFSRIMPGNFYRTLRGMLADSLIAESAERPAPDEDDERRRYFGRRRSAKRRRRGRASRGSGPRSAGEAAHRQTRMITFLYRVLVVIFSGTRAGRSPTTSSACSSGSSTKCDASGRAFG